MEAKDKKADTVEWKVPGFGIRTRGKTKRYLVQYRGPGGKQHREILGDPARVSYAVALAAAQQRFGQLAVGIDPSAERAKAKADATAARLTLARVAARYIEAKADILRPATIRASRWHLETLWEPLHAKGIGNITRAQIADRLTELVKNNGRVSAARARGTLSALYSWAAGEGLIESNPVSYVNNPNPDPQSRDRELDDVELRAIWRACSSDSDFERIVRLLILTGCRRHEIGGLLWGEIDQVGIRIPASRTKSGYPLPLPLPPAALDILRSIERRQGNEHVFGTSKNGFTAWSYSLATLNVRIAANEGRPLNAWRIHDLRRTMRTRLTRKPLGVPREHAERCIGHLVGTKVERTYDVNQYAPEIGEALARWADHLLTIVESPSANVVSLRA